MNKRRVILAIPRDFHRFNDLWTEEAVEKAAELEIEVTFIEKTPATKKEWADVLTGYEVLISSWCTPVLDAEVLADNSTLRLAAHAAGSVADLAGALPRNDIRISSANELMSTAVAEWCTAMSWTGLSNILKYANFGGRTPMNWNKQSKDFRYIRNSKIGIWGYGSISANYIKRLLPFEPASIMVNSRHGSFQDKIVKNASLEEIFSTADLIVLLAALTDENIGRINKDYLKLMRPGAVLMNPGRGRLVDEKDLLEALPNGKFTFISDTFHREPLPDNDPLQSFPNVILTPHCAGSNTSCYVPVMLEEASRFFDGTPLRYEVDLSRIATMTKNSLNSAGKSS